MALPKTDSSTTFVRLDHTIVPSLDKHRSAEFFAEIFGLAAPTNVFHFVQVRLSDGLYLDFDNASGDIRGQHYAFLVDGETFDAVLGRLQSRGLDYWADPGHRSAGHINTGNGGRGVYFLDPSGHSLEALTVRYDRTSLE